MRDYEVVVVGAGPAGCTVARRLAGKKKVLLVDASPLPRKKPCGGALNPHSWRFLKEFGVPERIILEPRTVHFRFVHWDYRVYRPTRLEFKNVSREGFDEWLLSLVPDEVEVYPRTSLTGLKDNGDGVEVTLFREGREETVEADYVVGADGPNSSVRRLIGFDIERYITMQDWVETAAIVPPYFDCLGTSRISPDFGYGYVMPKGEYTLIGSVFRPDSADIKSKHDRLVSCVREDYLPIGETIKQESALATRLRSLADIHPGKGRVLLAGEAGGFISPTSGEGISYALASGDACATAILDSSDDGALASYTGLVKPIIRNIKLKLRKLPLLDNRHLQRFIIVTPSSLVSRVVEKL